MLHRTLCLAISLIAVSSGIARGQALVAGTAAAGPGDPVTLGITLSSTGPVEGFSFGLAHDATVLVASAVTPGASLDPLLGGIAPDFFLEDLAPAGGAGITLGCVIDFGPPPFQSLAPGLSHAVANIAYLVAPAALPGTTAVSFSAGLGSPPVDLLLSVNALEIAPVTTAGSITVSAVSFVRGDMDGNGAINVVDAVIFLRRIFGLAPATGCSDSDDVDDNGVLNLTDAIYLLTYLFGSGPAVPGPVACGIDATTDSIGCSVYPLCP